MNKKEIERMISLADDSYIEELFTEKLAVRRKRPLLWFTAAAAAVIAVGIGLAALTSGNDNNDNKIVLESAITAEFRPEDYSVYFRNKKDGVSDVLLKEKDVPLYVVTDKSALVKILPFDTSDIFTAAADVVRDDSGNQYAAEVKLSYDTESAVNIIMCDEGGLWDFDIGNAVPEKMGGVDVYGFDVGGIGSHTCFEAYFVSNGTEYVVTGRDTDCNKLGGIIYGLIDSGFSAWSIDISGARRDGAFRSEEMSIEQANGVEPFAGFVPEPRDGFVLYRGVICTFWDTVGDSELYSMTVSYADVPPEPNTDYNKLIELDYNTEYKGDNGSEELPRLSEITAEDIAAAFQNSDSLTIDIGGFYLTVYSENCSAEEIWQYVREVKSCFGMEEDDYSYPTDNSVYFKNTAPVVKIDYTLDAGGEAHEIVFPEYSSEFLPFSAEQLDDRRAVIYSDPKGRIINAALSLNCSYVSKNYRMDIIFSDMGKVYPGFDTDGMEPVKWGVTDIYGCTLGEAGGGLKNLCAWFVVKKEGINDIGCTINSSGLTYDEVMNAINGIIENGVNIAEIAEQGYSPDKPAYQSWFRPVYPDERLEGEISLDICGSYNQYDKEYTKGVLKKCFDISGFTTVNATMFCDESGRQINGDIYLNNSNSTSHNEGFAFCSIRFSMENEKFNYYARREPHELCGVQVYCATEYERNGIENGKYIDFTVGSVSYSLQFYKMSCEDAVGVAAGIIKNLLSADDFNPVQAKLRQTVEAVDADRLLELNNDSPFAGYIPSAESIGDMRAFRDDGFFRNSYIAVQEKERGGTLSLDIYYRTDSETEDGRFIDLVYSDDCAAAEADHKSGIPLIELQSFTRDWLDGLFRHHGDDKFVRYNFYLTADGFYIYVNALCEPDEMWQCLCMIEPKLADNTGTEAVTEPIPEDDIVYYRGKAFRRSSLSEELLEWLDWYNSLDEEGQDMVSYSPNELM